MADFYIRAGGPALGPFTEDALRLRCAEADLADSTMSWRTGEKRWISLRRRWTKNRNQWMGSAIGWALSVAFAAAALIVSARLLDVPRSLQGFAMSTTVVVAASAFSLVVAWWHWAREARSQGRPTLSAVLCALLAGLASIGSLSTIGMQKRISDDRAAVKDASMVFDSVSGELHIDGNIADRFSDDLRASIERSPDIRLITIDSPGGLIEEALKAGNLLDQRRIPVRVLGMCASACTVFWSSASKREMRFGARLGLHQSRLDVDVPSLWRKAASEQADLKTNAILKLAGFSDALLKKQASTPAGDMYWLDSAELLESGVQLTIVDMHGAALSGSHVKFLSVASGFQEHLPFRKLMETYGTHAPELADKFGPDLYPAWHRDDADGLFRLAGRISSAAKAYAFVNAPAEALMDWMRHMQGLLQETIANSDTASCLVFLDGAQANDVEQAVNGRMVLAIVELIDAIPEGGNIDPSSVPRGSTTTADALVGRLFRQNAGQGFPLRYEQWSPLQKCKLMDGVYGATLRLPPSEAVKVIRAIEGF